MQFTVINMLWTILVFLFSFLITLIFIGSDMVYSPVYSLLVLVTGFGLGFCWASRGNDA
mgnify:CR=1 FL=1|jgi:hypothetical protein